MLAYAHPAFDGPVILFQNIIEGLSPDRNIGIWFSESSTFRTRCPSSGDAASSRWALNAVDEIVLTAG
jgi:hypothetical protein